MHYIFDLKTQQHPKRYVLYLSQLRTQVLIWRHNHQIRILICLYSLQE